MNFFESQDAARRASGKLFALFALAVVSLIALTNVLVMLVLGTLTSEQGQIGFSFDWQLFVVVSVGVGGVVALGSLYKIVSLRGGGARVAEMMNGRLLLPDSNDLLERRLLNVVEEMAIASGTPVPPVYVMDESGINAFAAGYSPSDAVIGVTRGAMETLNREQLQGVIAHEFSHILHGDMRINIRLIGVLHGIFVLGIIGYYILRSGSRSRRSKDAAGVAILGLGLVVIGYTGTFFGNLIKAAVSRQREYLADASAVQFTRNPEGIGGALMQIGAASTRSYLDHPASQEISHALFEEGSRSALSGLYATHPPLEDRIRAILPDWNGDYSIATKPDPGGNGDEETAQEQTSAKPELAVLGTLGVLAGGAVGNIGAPSAPHLIAASAIVDSLPSAVLAAARQPSSARALAYYLILDNDPAQRSQQCDYLAESADEGVYDELQRLLKLGWVLEDEQRLPLAEIALPALRQLSASQFALFRRNFEALIAQDNKIKLFEWCLQKFLFHHLSQVYLSSEPPGIGRKKLLACAGSVAVVLGVISYNQKSAKQSPAELFRKGVEELGLSVELPQAELLSYEQVDQALSELRAINPLQKPALLKACAACIQGDGVVSALEIDLLRTVAAILDCPMPPLTRSD